MDQHVTTCRGCGAPILFVKTARGRNHPLNTNPTKGWVFGPNGWDMTDVYTSHFVTCPQAARFRQAPARKGPG